MNQQQIKLHDRIDGPSVVPLAHMSQVKTYREAVRFGWAHRQVKNMTQATLAEKTGMRPSHIPEYLSKDDTDERGRELRDMPAKYIPAFEKAVGNSFASQWLAMESQLTVLEAMIADQKACV